MGSPPARVSELGEDALIARIAGRIQGSEDEIWSGDDAAVLRWGGRGLIVTTDTLVEGVDFRRETFSPNDVGWKAVAVNLSDIAAMGGTPTHILACLSLQPDTEVAFVDRLVDGMLECAESFEVSLVGGDISSAREITLGVTALGEAPEAGAVLRSGARPGDAICVTGSLGGAAAGLLILERGPPGPRDDPAPVARQRHPRPRVWEGNALAAAGASAMIDVSDGLAIDLWRLMEASETGCRVDGASIPADPSIQDPALRADLGVDASRLALTGGEDYELLFTISKERIERAEETLSGLGTPFARIGEVTAEPDRMIGDRPLEEWRDEGWDHLLGR